MKRVFLVHGWGGSPTNEWFPWLKTELEKHGFEVTVPTMPDTDNPKIETWIPHLKKTIGEIDKNTILVGHSMGGQAVLRYLESLPESKKILGVVLIASFVELTDESYETDDDVRIAKPWLKTHINWEKVKNSSENWFALFSDNDIYVPLSNADVFREKLGAKIIVDHNQGHYDQDSGITQIPSAFNEIIKLK